MFAKIASALALVAVVSQVAAAEPMESRTFVKMSARELFGIGRRDDGSYQPTQAVCSNPGDTCAQVCGDGFQTCLSTDASIHCFNQTAGQLCCSDNTGNSCDAGFYCAADPTGQTYCCPEGQDAAACAASFGVAAGLASESTRAATTSTTSTSSAYPTTTTVANTTTAYPTSNTTTSAESTTSCTSTITDSASYPASNATTAAYVQTTTVQTTAPAASTHVSVNGAAVAGPAGTLLLVAAAFAALL